MLCDTIAYNTLKKSKGGLFMSYVADGRFDTAKIKKLTKTESYRND